MIVQKVLAYTIPWNHTAIFSQMNHSISLKENIEQTILKIMKGIFEGKCFHDALIKSVDSVIRYREPTYTHGTIQTIVQRNVQCMTTCLIYSHGDTIVNSIAENKHANALFANAPNLRVTIEKDTENQVNSIVQDGMTLPIIIEATTYQPFKKEILGQAKLWHPQWKPLVIFEVEPGETMETIVAFREKCKSPEQLSVIGNNIALKLIYPGMTPRKIPAHWNPSNTTTEYPKFVCWVPDSPYIIYEFDASGLIETAEIRKGTATAVFTEVLAIRNRWYETCKSFQETFPDEQAFAKNRMFWKWCMQKKKDKKTWTE